MKILSTIYKAVLGVFAVGVVLVFAQITQRPLNQSGLTSGWSFGTSLPTVANDGRPPFNGEPFVLVPNGGDPVLRVYNDFTSSWDTVAALEGSNSRTTIREDFEGPNFQSYDITNGDFVPSVADTEFNMYAFQNMNIWSRLELAFAGTNTPETFLSQGVDSSTDGTGRVFLIDDATILDVADNDAIEYNFGGDPTEAVIFYENASTGLDTYCEVGLRIDDISNVSALDLYFGIFLAAAVNDTFAFTASDTWAAFAMADTAGDLQICAEEDGDTHGCDDAAETWADNETHVLRVTVSADAVAFYVDGALVTPTNAIMDADAGDEFVCRLGIRSAGTTKANVELNYVEIGHPAS